MESACLMVLSSDSTSDRFCVHCMPFINIELKIYFR